MHQDKSRFSFAAFNLVRRSGFAGVLVLLSFGAHAAKVEWPDYRGPFGDGHVSAPGETKLIGLPLDWSETNHVKWKTPIHGRSWSSPVIWGNQIWLTTATEDGRQLLAVCVDRDSGKIVHDLKVFEVGQIGRAHV